MSGNEPGWAAPGGQEPPRWGERVPGSAQPAATPPPMPPQAWTPPPRPGLVPLHPLGFGQLLGIAFATIRWNPKATILPAVLINLLQTVVLYGLGLLVALPGVDRIQQATDADRGPVIAGVVAEGSGVVLLSIALGLIGAALLQGVVVTVVARGALGERPGPAAVLRAAAKRVVPLAGFALLIGAAELVVIALLALLVFAISQAGVVGVVLAVVTGVLGILGIAVLVAWITVKLCVVPSSIVLEHLGVRAAIRRSWTLMRGGFWRTLGLIVVVTLIVSAAAQVIALPVSVVGGALLGVLAPNLSSSDPLQAFASGLISGIPAAFVTVIVGGIGQIAQVAAVALVYLDQRMRREGLDIELQRAVEQPGSGDPYATGTTQQRP